MEFYPIDSKITPDLIVRAIKHTWSTFEENQKNTELINQPYTNASELTYYLFDNLFQGAYYDRQCMEVLYNTLIEMNTEVENLEMVEHLQIRKKEYITFISNKEQESLANTSNYNIYDKEDF